MVVFTGVIAITGIIGSIIFGQQLAAMKGQLAEMQSAGRQTESLAQATDRLAAASARSAEVAENSLIKLQRAFLSISRIRYLSHLGDDGKVWWSIHVDWQNSGNSPAKKAQFFTTKYSDDKDIPTTFKFAVPSDRPELFIGPHAGMTTGDLGIAADELMAAQERRKFLYIWGRVDYRDIFDGTPDHVTKFLVQIKGFRGDVTKVWDEKTNFVEFIMDTVGRHNCADEDCSPD